MKIKIKCFNGVLPDYLTEGKVYEVKPHENGIGGWIVADNGVEGYTCFKNTAHLNGGSWEVVDA